MTKNKNGPVVILKSEKNLDYLKSDDQIPLEINNFVVLSGRVTGTVKGGLTKTGSFFVSFVLSVPKGKFISPGNMNYLGCVLFDVDKAKVAANLQEGDWVKVIGKLNTYRYQNQNKCQVIVDEVNLINVFQ